MLHGLLCILVKHLSMAKDSLVIHAESTAQASTHALLCINQQLQDIFNWLSHTRMQGYHLQHCLISHASHKCNSAGCT